MPEPRQPPVTWQADPPTTLVVGEGPYARALAQVLGAAILGSEEMLAGPAPNESGSFPRVLGALETVFVVAGTSQSASDLLHLHDALWNWVERLSLGGDQHELSILFVLPPSGTGLDEALAAGLGLESFAPDVPGHGLARMGASLEDLLSKAVAIVPQDLPPLLARQAVDRRHAVLKALIQAPEDELPASAKRVNEAFRGQEFLLDLFCRPPSHRNGNQLRGWLNAVVTEEVTPYDGARFDGSPSDWLDEGRFP